MRYGMLLAICALWTAPAAALERPDVNFQIFQFPADMIPRVDGDPVDWAMVPAEYAIGAVDTRYKATRGVWIVREETGFYVLSTVCTHLGCTPNWLAGDEKFKCPCHGSGFIVTGVNVEGPAPRPLERFKVTRAEDGQLLIDKNTKFQDEKGQWAWPGAYLDYVG